jgi:surface protein
MSKIKSIISILIIVCTLYLTVGFSAFVSEISISSIAANIRVEKDIRITDLIASKTEKTTINSLNFDDNSIVSNIKFDSISSYIIYNVTITNIGNAEIGIYDLTLPEGISYEISNYNLKDKICNNNSCNLGISKEIIIKVYPSSETGLNIKDLKIDFNFRKFHPITYTGLTNNNYPTSIIDGGTLNIQIKNPPEFINVFSNGIELNRTTYLYNNGNLVIDNITNNTAIEIAESTLLDGKVFSKTLKDFVNNTTESAYNSTDTTVTYIGIYEDEIPEGYTEETFFSLPSISVSENNRVKAFHDSGRVYLYSKDDILAPAVSYSLFRGYTNLTELNITKLNTKNMTDPGAMFQDNTSLEYLDISTFDTKKVYRLFYTFAGCTSLKQINLPSFENTPLEKLEATFLNCHSLNNLDLSKWNTSKLTTMASMFENCHSLTNLNLSNWDTSKVIKMSYLFRYNKSLTTIDISSFDTSNVTDMSRMFGYCDKLENIYVGSGWDTSNVTESASMFSNSPLLPNFNQDYVDHTKAYVGDGGYLSYLPK